MNPNWDDIRVFLALCRTSSFVAAARQLKVTHSTVSRRISALEAALQSELFIRTERGCSLTAAGEKLLPLAEEIENTALLIQEQHIPNDSQLAGTIRIGTPDGLGTCFLAAKLSALQIANPSLQIELISVPMYYSLSKKEVDILITVKKPTTPKIVAKKITNYKLGLFASRTYLNNFDPIREISDLHQHSFVGYIDDLLYDQNLRFLDEFSPKLQTVFRSSTITTQMNALKAAVGIGVIPYFMAYTENDLIPVLPDKSIEREFWIQVNPDSRKLIRVKTTMNFIVEQIKGEINHFLALPSMSQENRPAHL